MLSHLISPSLLHIHKPTPFILCHSGEMLPDLQCTLVKLHLACLCTVFPKSMWLTAISWHCFQLQFTPRLYLMEVHLGTLYFRIKSHFTWTHPLINYITKKGALSILISHNTHHNFSRMTCFSQCIHQQCPTGDASIT